MKVLLVQPPIRGTTASVTPPLGLAYLAAVLERRGTAVECLMADVERLSLDEITKRIVAIDPSVIGISTTTPSVNYAVELVQRIKRVRPAFHTIAGGAHATLFPHDMLKAGFDYVVCGEGEETIVELMDVIEGKREAQSVLGLAFTMNGNPGVNAARPFIKDLDSLPFPAWHLFPLASYKSDFKKTDSFLPLITSRGCPGRCVFCYKGLFGNKFRYRSPDHIIAELSYLINRFHIAEFSILDDNFTTLPARVMRFCSLLKEHDIALPWTLSSGVRADTASEEMFKALKAAGCYRVGFGVESGNDAILKSIKKGISKDKMREAMAMAKKAGMEVYGFFMIGNLHETRATINDTIRFAKELAPDVAQFSVATPFPGSEMYTILKNQGKITTTNWDDFDYLSGKQCCFEHDHLTQEEIARTLRRAYYSFYLRPRYILKKMRAIGSASELKRNFKAMLRLLKFS